MTQHLGQAQIRRFLGGELSPEELLVADDHLAACSKCLAKISDQPAVAGASEVFEHALHARSLLDEDHLNYEELEAFADRKLEKETLSRATAHLAVCSECAGEAQELRGLVETIVEAKVIGTASAVESLPETIRRWFSRTGLSFAAAAVCISALVGIGWLMLRNSGRAETEIAGADQNAYQPVTRSVDLPYQAQRPTTSGSDNQNGVGAEEPGNAASVEQSLRLALVDGGATVGLDESGRLVGYSNAMPKYRDAAAKALEKGTVAISPDVAELRPVSGVAMGDGEGGKLFALRGPVGKVIADDAPVFNWQPVPGAESYQLSVYDANFGKVADSGPLRKTTWATKLPRGKIYTWQVTAVKDGKEFKSPERPAPDARFKIAGVQELAEIESIKRQFPKARLLLGIIYAEVGLLDEAAAQFEALRRQNPNSVQVRQLLQRIETARSTK